MENPKITGYESRRWMSLDGLPLQRYLVLFPKIVSVEKSNPRLSAGSNTKIQSRSHVPSLLLQHDGPEFCRNFCRSIGAVVGDNDYFTRLQRLGAHTSNGISDKALGIESRDYNRDGCGVAGQL
jgi:hypothetical protein